MGCLGSKQASTYYESMLKKLILYTKTKYKTINQGLDKHQIAIDETALDDIGLFISAQLNKGQRQLRIEKVPSTGREVPICSPFSIGHFMKMIYQLFGWPLTTAVIDLSFHEIVSPELVTSLIFALNTVDICRTLNLTKQPISDAQSGIMGAWLASTVNLQFLSLVGCGLSHKAICDICEGLLRLARKRAKLEEIGRCDEISINEQEAFLYEVPKLMAVKHGLFGLDVSRNKMDDSDCSKIIDSLQNHIDLQFLGMAGCGVGELSSKALFEIVHNMKNLSYIDFSDNPTFDDKCLAYLYKQMLNGNYRLQQIMLTGCSISAKYEQKIIKILNRNQAVCQAYDDLLEGAFVRLFNSGEMAGDCHGKGSDNYIEYCTSEYFPTDLTPEESALMNKIFKYISIQEGYVKSIARILCSGKESKADRSSTMTENNGAQPAIQDFTISLSETIGRRPEMEDIVAIHADFQEFRYKRMNMEFKANEHYEILICLFDGHGGIEIAQQCGNLFPACFADTLNAILRATGLQYAYQLPDKIWEPLMFSVFQRVDETLRQRQSPAGSTCVITFITEHTVISANSGDSRAILVREEGSARRIESAQQSKSVISRNSTVDQTEVSQQAGKIFKPTSLTQSQTQINDIMQEFNFDDYFVNKTFDETVNSKLNPNDIVLRLSKDHKPDLPEEKRRIESVGGYVHQGRVLSTLAVARGFGDFTYKPSVTCSPYINVYTLQKQDAWVIVCCDGVWDVLSDVDAALLVHRSMTAGVAAITLRDESFRLDSGDNISAIAMRLFLK
ncbi:Protein_phosphatase 2C [Hexamita inflata]|uniref:protein-serine/threonine phosphatase n=1 Tax=Hexamita inflata TaxID=28002 RepID=A0AA86QXZ3_9EUKA|nr:Protein phosphatase 2C [Hexamita inflata]